MYRHLYTNLPKECTEFSDYTYDEHFGRPVPSYLNREQTRDYFIGRQKGLNIRDYIHFETAVRYVEHNPETDLFSIRIQNIKNGTSRTEDFDHVVVASGHLSTPNIPSFEGMDNFPGRIVHSHDFRDAREYFGQQVLIIGSGLSAEDIALQLFKFGAKSIVISYRTKPLGFKWPERIIEVPLLTRLDGKTGHFRDGSKWDFDSIILCTGYRHHFPFMAPDLCLNTANLMYPENLYKGIFLQSQPRVAYLGMNKFTFGFPGLDIQAWYVRDFLLGRISIPHAEERFKEAAEWLEREKLAPDLVGEILFSASYFKDLLSAIDYPTVNFDGSLSIGRDFSISKLENILEYRDKIFTSYYTGTEAAKNQIPWIDADRSISKTEMKPTE